MKDSLKTRIFILSIVLLFVSSTVFSQQAVVRGLINDKTDGLPLAGVSILYDKNKGIASDNEGRFELRLEPGIYKLHFKMIGYQDYIHLIQLKSGEQSELNILLQQHAVEMEQVVVTASRYEQKIAELSVSMSVLTADKIDKQQISNAQELMDKAPGIEVMDGQASIRGGSGYSYGVGSRVLALLDGLPILAADVGSIRWQFLPLDNLSQVEIIKGASSVAYGSSALNGVINFRTADATSYPTTKIYSEIGIYDAPSNKNWKWWDSPRLFGTVGFNHLQKKNNTDFGIGINAMSNNGYRKNNEETVLRMHTKLKHFDKKIEGLQYGYNFNAAYNSKTDFLLWEDATYGALKLDISTAAKLHAQFFALDPFLSYYKPGKARHDVKMRLQLSDNTFPYADKNNSKALSLYADYQFHKQLNHLFALSSGFSAYAVSIQSKFYENHRSFNPSIFSQLEITPAEALKIVAGMRLENFFIDGAHKKQVPLFRTGLNYQLHDYSYIRASFGQGYRFPSIAERFASTSLGSITVFPNIDIKPEKGWNAEIGFKQALRFKKMKAHIDLALFYAEHKQMIEYAFVTQRNPMTNQIEPGFRAINIEAARIYGFEIEWFMQWGSQMLQHQLMGSYVFMQPNEFYPHSGKNTDKKLKYRRKHALKLNYELAYKSFDFGLNAYFRSKLLRVDDIFLSDLILSGFNQYWHDNNRAYLLFDSYISYQITAGFSLSFMTKNLTNTEYMGRPGDIRPPRSYMLRATLNL